MYTKFITFSKQIIKKYEDTLQEYLNEHKIEISVRDASIIQTIIELKKTNDNTTSAIAKETKLTPSAISITTKSLEKKGYIYRYHDVDDRRQIYVSPTNRIVEFLNQYTYVQKKILDTIFEDIDSSISKDFIKTLTLLKANALKL